MMALNGTREGLYNAAMALCTGTEEWCSSRSSCCPNPFYQVYHGRLAVGRMRAAILLVPATRSRRAICRIMPACLSDVLNRTAVAYICSPANPQGAVASRDYLGRPDRVWPSSTIFRIFADECYSEIYREEAADRYSGPSRADLGADPERITLFNSLSKRSNLAGACGRDFVAGGPQVDQTASSSCAPMPASPLPLPACKLPRQSRLGVMRNTFDENRAPVSGKIRHTADEVSSPGVQGYHAARGRILPVAAGREMVKTGRIESLEGNRRPGPAGRISFTSAIRRKEPRAKDYIRAALVAPKTRVAAVV